MDEHRDGSAAPATLAPSAGSRGTVYKVGTLRYTTAGIVIVFFWLLMGNFTLMVMESVMPQLLPLTLRDHNASNQMIGILSMSMGAMLSMVFTPIISYRSDQYRGPRGRRIPYLLWPTPFISLFLIIVGFCDEIGNFIHGLVVPLFSNLQPSTVILITVGFAAAMYNFFNLFVTSVVFYLYNDVVPEALLGRFYGLFRVVGSLGGISFNLFLMPYAEHPVHRKWIYVIAGVVYCGTFMLMCFRVREGSYPPPDVPKGVGFLVASKTYLYECFSLPFYWCYFFGTALYFAGSSCYYTFRIFLSEQIGMSKADFGQLNTVTFVVGMFLFLVLGWVSDKIHPLRLYLVSLLLVPASLIASAWMVNDQSSFWFWTIIWSAAHTVQAAAYAPMDPSILPRGQFGQFSSAANIVRSATTIFGPWAGGILMDRLQSEGIPIHYRAIFWWYAGFVMLSIPFMLVVYWQWRKLGGRHGYIAPLKVPKEVAGGLALVQ